MVGMLFVFFYCMLLYGLSCLFCIFLHLAFKCCTATLSALKGALKITFIVYYKKSATIATGCAFSEHKAKRVAVTLIDFSTQSQRMKSLEPDVHPQRRNRHLKFKIEHRWQLHYAAER